MIAFHVPRTLSSPARARIDANAAQQAAALARSRYQQRREARRQDAAICPRRVIRKDRAREARWLRRLADLRKAEQRLEIGKVILREVAAAHGVSVADITGPRRWQYLCAARTEAYWRFYSETTFSVAEIARRIGGRDHTTVLKTLRNRYMPSHGLEVPSHRRRP